MRDKNNNLISISSSYETPTSSGSYIELTSSTEYTFNQDLIDFDFKEFTSDNVSLNINNLPDYLIVVTKSDYYQLQEEILNLKDDLNISQSIFDIEKEALVSQNDALFKTILSIHQAGKNIADSLLVKYYNNADTYNDISSIYYIYSSSYDYVINNSSSLVNRIYTDTDKVFVQSPGQPSGSFIPIDKTKIIYNLQFDDNFLYLSGSNITQDKKDAATRNKYDTILKAVKTSIDNLNSYIALIKKETVDSQFKADDPNAIFNLTNEIVNSLLYKLTDIRLGNLASINFSNNKSTLEQSYEDILNNGRVAIKAIEDYILYLKRKRYSGVNNVDYSLIKISQDIYKFYQSDLNDIIDKDLNIKNNILVRP